MYDASGKIHYKRQTSETIQNTNIKYLVAPRAIWPLYTSLCVCAHSLARMHHKSHQAASQAAKVTLPRRACLIMHLALARAIAPNPPAVCLIHKGGRPASGCFRYIYIFSIFCVLSRVSIARARLRLLLSAPVSISEFVCVCVVLRADAVQLWRLSTPSSLDVVNVVCSKHTRAPPNEPHERVHRPLVGSACDIRCLRLLRLIWGTVRAAEVNNNSHFKVYVCVCA